MKKLTPIEIAQNSEEDSRGCVGSSDGLSGVTFPVDIEQVCTSCKHTWNITCKQSLLEALGSHQCPNCKRMLSFFCVQPKIAQEDIEESPGLPTCPKCHGAGDIEEDGYLPCQHCGGNGVLDV